jgi:prepilin-type N-terminal cleavage/methylation domain-containing protein
MNRKRAFTLVELLVVVVIIGILSSLVTVGVMSAVQAAKRSKIAMEMHQITLALETYKNKFGEYPPDLYDKAAVVRHVKKRWPRFQLAGSGEDQQYFAFMQAIDNVYRGAGGTATYYMDNITSVTTITREASYVGALPLWLGGFPNSDKKFSGFSADPEAPFGKGLGKKNSGDTPTYQTNNGDTSITWTGNIELGTQDKDSVFYEMIIGKNIEYVTTADNITFPVLVNRDATVNKDGETPVPYVYFKSNNSRGGNFAYLYPVGSSDSDYSASAPFIYKTKFYGFNTVFSGAWSELKLVSVYAKSGDPFASSNATPIIWQESERFQLIHPGLDGVFGGDTPGTGSVSLDATKTLSGKWFRSINTDATDNTIGQKDFDNLTNFSDYQQIKSILP